MKVLKTTLLLLLLLCSAAGCSRRTMVSDRELALIIRDAFLSNAYVNIEGIRLDSLRLYEPIFNRYGYTTADVQYTIGSFATRKSARLSDVVESAISMLERDGMQLDKEVAILDTVDNISIRRTTNTLISDSLRYIDRWADTTRLEIVVEDLIEGSYNLSLDYRIEFPDSVRSTYRSRWWVERLVESKVSGERDSVTTYGTGSMQMKKKFDGKFTQTIKVEPGSHRLVFKLAQANREEGPINVSLQNIKLVEISTTRNARQTLFDQLVDIKIFNDELLSTKDSL